MLETKAGTETSKKPDNIMEHENHAKINKMREALTSIATEMQRFEASTVDTLGDSDENEKVLAEMLKYKTKINVKRDRIQKLRKNLRTACFVAKTVASAKEKESGSLKQHLTCARTECADLLERYTNNCQTLNSLSRENEVLRSKLDNVSYFIQLAYRKLQKIRYEPLEDTSTLSQLKKLIVSCGQYYADYHNEHEWCLQLKQKNRFLINKICILEYNIEGLSEQLKSLKYRNSKLQKENDVGRNRCQKSKSLNELGVAIEGFSTDDTVNGITQCKWETDDSQSKLDPQTDFDLSPHLLIVKKLLNDQDTLIQDLKVLSEEFLNEGEPSR